MSDNSILLLGKYYKNDYWASDFKKSKSQIRNVLSKIPWLQFEYLRANSQFEYVKDFSGSVLDVGAGKGITGLLFAKKGYSVSVLEPDKQNISQLQKNDNITTYNGNFENIEISEKFDIIVLSHVLEHVVDIKKFLNSLKKILTNKGIIFIEVPNCKNEHELLDSINKSPHLSHFNMNCLKKLLEILEFESVKYNTMYFTNDLSLFQHGIRFLKFLFFKKDVYIPKSSNSNILRIVIHNSDSK